MNDPAGETGLPSLVPLFPLPNVVLFPRVVLPLHIFEERYKRMTADVLTTHKTIAMALLRPGWEKQYYNRPAIEPVVCVGQIVSHERLADGRYNFLLQGTMRARVVAEVDGEPYRRAVLEPLAEQEGDEDDLGGARERLLELFARDSYANLPGGMQIRRMLANEVPTATVADLLAFLVLGDEEVGLKQSLLAETNVRRRVGRTIEALAALCPAWRNTPESAGLN
jgi:Lon protease-like protein